MFPFVIWVDEVTEYENRFIETKNEDGTVSHAKYPGKVMQLGTPQDATHFNRMEQGIFGAHLAIEILRQALANQRIVFEKGTIELKNSLGYPFNNSCQTIPLKEVSDTTTYTVICEIASSDGIVESLVVTDKLVNGFKLAYTGSAKSAVINYTVIGGYLA